MLFKSKEEFNIIHKILIDAVSIERYADKSNLTYPFLETEEVNEIVDNMLEGLDNANFEIRKSKGL